jgi:hypothetical protein
MPDTIARDSRVAPAPLKRFGVDILLTQKDGGYTYVLLMKKLA